MSVAFQPILLGLA